ncbi:EAL domain-containing protein [Cupriavidus basilensis]
MILPAVGDAGVAEGIAQAILQRIAAPYRLAGELVMVSASIGVATYPKDADNAEALLVCADQAMFAAKEEGRNRWKVFTQALLQAEKERLRITQDLRTALAAGQFALHYQPIINLRTGKVCKAEALIRWNHPVRGPIHPADFIAVAEESGLIIDIGRWVLTEALDQLARWQVLLGDGFQISVNKSPMEFCSACERARVLVRHDRAQERAGGQPRHRDHRRFADGARTPMSWISSPASRRPASRSRSTTSAPATRPCRTCDALTLTTSRSTSPSSAR